MTPQERRKLYQQYLRDPRFRALAGVIQKAEGTWRADNPSLSYRVQFGGGLLPAEQLKKGYPDTVYGSQSGIRSAAAGAYQFMPGTWQSAANTLGITDFSGPSQDEIFADLVKRRYANRGGLAGVVRDLEQGNFDDVWHTLAGEWAALPTKSGQSFYNQPVKRSDWLKEQYNNFLANPPQLGGAYGGTVSPGINRSGTNGRPTDGRAATTSQVSSPSNQFNFRLPGLNLSINNIMYDGEKADGLPQELLKAMGVQLPGDPKDKKDNFLSGFIKDRLKEIMKGIMGGFGLKNPYE